MVYVALSSRQVPLNWKIYDLIWRVLGKSSRGTHVLDHLYIWFLASFYLWKKSSLLFAFALSIQINQHLPPHLSQPTQLGT